MYDREGIDERNVRLEFKDNSHSDIFHSFRIKTINKRDIFWSTFWLGLGASLIGSTIMFPVQFLLTLFNNKENKKLRILDELLNKQRKIRGIPEKTLEKLKKEFNKI